MDTAHSVLEKRLGVEVTPETINEYMEPSTTHYLVVQ
jgi:methyl-coenzyme M reductase alpha subunit